MKKHKQVLRYSYRNYKPYVCKVEMIRIFQGTEKRSGRRQNAGVKKSYRNKDTKRDCGVNNKNSH